jgi:hypothetical protein
MLMVYLIIEYIFDIVPGSKLTRSSAFFQGIIPDALPK